MQIRNQVRNEFRRTASPHDTIERVRKALVKLDLKETINVKKVHDRLWSIRLTIDSLRAAVNGKGSSEELAVASAYAEMAERLSAGMETGIAIGQFRQLYGPKGNHLSNVTLYKYMEGYRWCHQGSIENAVGAEDLLRDIPGISKEMFEHIKMESELLRHWIPGWSLVHNKEVYVPILLVKWISSTNGLASGNTMEEAIVHGACEVFERDAMIKFLELHPETPIIDPATIENPLITEMLGFFKNNDIDVIIRDISLGLYPVYAALTFNRNLPTNYVGYNHIKAGSSFDTDEAIVRCFTERMQGTDFAAEKEMGPRQEGDDPDKYLPGFFRGICPLDLTPYSDGESIKYEPFTEENTATEVGLCVDIAKAMNTDLIAINHTHPVFNFPTVRMVMPGVSDFMKWWDPHKLTPELVTNLQPEEDEYERKLMKMLDTFFFKARK